MKEYTRKQLEHEKRIRGFWRGLSDEELKGVEKRCNNPCRRGQSTGRCMCCMAFRCGGDYAPECRSNMQDEVKRRGGVK